MTQHSSADAVVAVIGLWSVAGALLGLSSLFGTAWWVNLIIVVVAAGVAMAVFESDEDAGIGVVGLLALFAIYGYVSSLGWVAAIGIAVAPVVLAALLISDGPTSEPPAPRPPARRATAPPSTSRPHQTRSVSDETLERYARQFLDDGGARDTRAVLSALRRRVSDERLVLDARQDLSWIASRALASTRSPAPPSGPRRTPAASARPSAPRQQAAGTTEKPRRNVRERLHEFGSFEIERAISNILEVSPRLTDEQLVDQVLAALGTEDRSPFALERLSDAIGRVREPASPSAQKRTGERKPRRVDRVPKRDPGRRTKLHEYGSAEIERVVGQLFDVDPKWSAKDLHEAVLEVLGIQDRSNLARQRVTVASAKVSASLKHAPAAGRPRESDTKKTGAKKTGAKKATKKKASKKATKKTTEKRPAKKVTKRTTETREKRATGEATRQDATPKPERNRESGRSASPSTPAEKRSTRSDDEGTPDVKDIAKLLGF